MDVSGAAGITVAPLNSVHTTLPGPAPEGPGEGTTSQQWGENLLMLLRVLIPVIGELFSTSCDTE